MACGYVCTQCGKCQDLPPIVAGKCPFCQSINEPTAKRCSTCGKPLMPPPGVVEKDER